MEKNLHLETFHSERDSRFSTNCDYKVAKIFANDMLESYLTIELHKLEDKECSMVANTTFPKPRLTWTGNKSDLIEIIYALDTFACFNHGKTNLKSIVTYFENMFNIDLGANISRVFSDLRIRQNRTAFLDRLKYLLIERMDNADK